MKPLRAFFAAVSLLVATPAFAQVPPDEVEAAAVSRRRKSRQGSLLEGIDRALLCGLKVPERIWIHLFMNRHRTNRVFGRFVARTPFCSEVFARDGMSFCQVR